MKTVITVAVVVVVQSFAVGCPKDCYEYQGACACDAMPEKALTTPPSGAVSSEKPPQDKLPSYERANVKADMPQSLIAQDAKADQARSQADTQGKVAAGLK